MTFRISYERHAASTNNKERAPQKFLDLYSRDESVSGPTSRRLDGYISKSHTKIFRQKSHNVKFSIAAFLSFACPFLFPHVTPMMQKV